MLVQLTLTGDCNGVFVARRTASNFTVRELNGGNTNAGFMWGEAERIRSGYWYRGVKPAPGPTTPPAPAVIKPNDGRYSWNVPNTFSSNNCFVKVEARDNHGNTGSDTSDSTFSILQTDSSTKKTIPAGTTDNVTGPPESGTTVEVNASGNVTVTVAHYSGNPHPEAPKPAAMLNKYIDVAVSDKDNITWPMYVRMNYTEGEIPAGVDENTLGLYYYKNGAWHKRGSTGVNTDENYVWANVAKEEYAGSPFGPGGSSPPVPVPVFSPEGLLSLVVILSTVLVIALRRRPFV